MQRSKRNPSRTNAHDAGNRQYRQQPLGLGGRVFHDVVRLRPDRIRVHAGDLLTPIAADLGVSEGNTGQAISISGVVAVITRQQDRRLVVLALTRC